MRSLLFMCVLLVALQACACSAPDDADSLPGAPDDVSQAAAVAVAVSDYKTHLALMYRFTQESYKRRPPTYPSTPKISTDAKLGGFVRVDPNFRFKKFNLAMYATPKPSPAQERLLYDNLRIYRKGDASGNTIVLSFRGTETSDPDDVKADLDSQFKPCRKFADATIASSIEATIPVGDDMVVDGFSYRWENLWKLEGNWLKTYILSSADIMKRQGKRLRVLATGHSLGAAAAQLAAIDIAWALEARGVKHAVRVYSFNAPRIACDSKLTMFSGYSSNLFVRMATLRPPSDTASVMANFAIQNFARWGDAVQSLPLGRQSAVWNRAVCQNGDCVPSRKVSSFSRSLRDKVLGYCPMYDSRWRPHAHVNPWNWQIANMPSSHVACMAKAGWMASLPPASR